METGHPDYGRTDYSDAQGTAPCADGGTQDTGELGSHNQSDWDVQVSRHRSDWYVRELMAGNSFTGINSAQSKALVEDAHVYMTANGRISMAGLNTHNLRYFAERLDSVVRGSK